MSIATRDRRAPSSWTASARLIVAAVLFCAPAVAGCTEQASPSPAPVTACDAPVVRGTCASIGTGGQQWRYALLRAPRSTTRTVLVDFGGPGLAVLAGNGRLQAFRDAFPRLADGANLLALEEPWVRRTPSPACRTALRRYYHDVREVGPYASHAVDVRYSCRLSPSGEWGFEPAGFDRAIRAVLRQERLRLDGFVGMSFGSVRLSYLTDPRPAWSVLVRPFPVGATGTEVIDSRAQRTAAIVLESGNGTAVTANSDNAGRFDLLSALVELGYLDDRQAADLLPHLTHGDAPALAHTLAGQLWQTYGDGDLSAGFLAYLDEMCRVAAPWPGSAAPAGDLLTVAVGTVLAAAHRPCGSETPPRPVVSGTDRMCLVVSATDPVASEALVRRQYAALKQVRWVRSAVRSHSSLDGLAGCLDQVAAAGR
ncbi:hypothetical protein AB0M80_34745 [Amycolatopsis sp. NPDC051045]|uniref:hypothetical protein n=1 Tax=Amycolatopsis sp. NPDC051045 TaxID=3156922 RepID=UPI00344A354F